VAVFFKFRSHGKLECGEAREIKVEKLREICCLSDRYMTNR